MSSKLSKSQRHHLADKLMDSANYVLALFVLGVFTSEIFDSNLVFAGIILFFYLLYLTTKMRKE